MAAWGSCAEFAEEGVGRERWCSCVDSRLQVDRWVRAGEIEDWGEALRGVDGREDGRSEGSRTVDELLERESVVAAEMRSRKLGKMKTGNWEDSREDGRDGRFPWWRMEERDREEGEGRDEAFSVEEGEGCFPWWRMEEGDRGRRGRSWRR